METKGIIFFTDNRLDERIAYEVQKQLLTIGLPIVSASLKPMDFGTNIHLPLERGYETYFKQILAALEASTADIIFFCEHDVLYPKEHFDFTPPHTNVFYYDHNWVKVRLPDLLSARWSADQVSGLVAYREVLLDHYRKIVASYSDKDFNRKFEPGSGLNSKSWKSPVPTVDIRHWGNLTKSKWSLDDFRDKRTSIDFEIVECPNWALPMVQKMIQ